MRTRGRDVCTEEREAAVAMHAGASVDRHYVYCCGLAVVAAGGDK